MNDLTHEQTKRLREHLNYLTRSLNDDEMLGLLSVWIERKKDGTLERHVSFSLPDEIDQSHIDTIMRCLHDIADALQIIQPGGDTQRRSSKCQLLII